MFAGLPASNGLPSLSRAVFEGQLLVQKEWALGSEFISQAWHQRALGVHIPACHLALGESLCPSSTRQLKTGGWSHLKSPSHISGAWHTHTHTHTHTRTHVGPRPPHSVAAGLIGKPAPSLRASREPRWFCCSQLQSNSASPLLPSL